MHALNIIRFTITLILAVVGVVLAAAPPACADDGWRLAPGTFELHGANETVEFELVAAGPLGGEVRVEQPAAGYDLCRHAARWRFDRDVRRLYAGDEVRVELEVETLAGGDACAADGPNAPKLEVVAGSGGAYRPLFELAGSHPRLASLRVATAAADAEGSFVVRVAAGGTRADSEWKYVPVRRFAVPENERGDAAVVPFEPGPGGSRVFRLPPRDDPPGATETLETRRQHAAKFVCSLLGTFHPLILVEGTYRTVINVHNPGAEEVSFASRVSISLDAGAAPGGPFRLSPPRLHRLGPDESLELDCGDVAAAFCPIDGVCVDFAFAEGFVLLDSPSRLDVAAVLSAGPPNDDVASVDLERVPARRVANVLEVPVPPTPIPTIDPVFETPVDRPGPIFPAAVDFQAKPCPSQCVDDTTMIIGCDGRLRGPKTVAEGAFDPPWRHVGRLSNGCSGTLIGPQHVLTAAHCVLSCGEDFVSGPLHFRLAQVSAGPCGRPFGTYYVERIFAPAAYDNCTGNEEDRALDYAVLELANPIPDATAMAFGHVPWSTLQHKTPFSIGYPSDKPVGSVWQTGSVNSFLPSPNRWLEGGEKGLVRITNDGVDGQSGSPVYVFQGGQRRVTGVLIGSPLSACQQGRMWASRITPGAAEHVENAMLFPPHGNVLDFFWNWHELPDGQILPDEPASEGCGF